MIEADEGEELLEPVLHCAEQYTATAFKHADEVLYRRADPWSSVGLLPRAATWRGELLLSIKSRSDAGDAVDPSDQRSTGFCLLPSAFPRHRSSTIRFFSAFAKLPDQMLSDCVAPVHERSCKEFQGSRESEEDDWVVRVERIARHRVTLGCMKRSGMVLSKTSTLWNLHWGARLKDDGDFSKLLSFQKVNHFPGTWVMGRKDALARHLRRAAQRHKSGGYDLLAPFTYTWPLDLPLVLRDAKEGHCFIVKPPARARGEGISLFSGTIPTFLMDLARTSDTAREKDKKEVDAPLRKPLTKEQPGARKVVRGKLEASGRAANSTSSSSDDSDDEEDTSVIIQRYLTRPLLINGFKVDLRVYVVCTSFDPLRLYVYNEGLVRFASEPYPSPQNLVASLSNVYQHLTNYSINKTSSAYKEGSTDGAGSKWSFHAFRRYFEAMSWDWDGAWEGVHDAIIKTFIAVEGTVCAKTSSVRHRFNCFELYGFDIMLDENRAPHIIEVNVMPSLACGAAIDKHVKGQMIADMLTLVGIPAMATSDKASISAAADAQREQRRVGVPNAADPDKGPSTLLRTDEGNNVECRSVKYDVKKWEDPAGYFSTHATDDDRAVLRDSEDELRRCLGFQRVFPTPQSQKRYASLFDSQRHYNKLLWCWEEWKHKAKAADLQEAIRWLKDEGPFPHASTTKRVRSLTLRPLPRCAEVSSAPANVKSRVSASPRVVTARTPTLPPLERRPVPVSVFTFITVPQK